MTFEIGWRLFGVLIFFGLIVLTAIAPSKRG